ncbi:MAG: iron-containing redox enzyme family protein [Gammaproteobacteria bacterium]|nr:iron-containing redox enzyme family protein [Gammaproteobacteria bacterium]
MESHVNPSFHDRLVAATGRDRQFLLGAPVITDALAGRLDLPRYLAFLSQAWQHVRHTVPLLMSATGRLPERLNWLQKDMLHYIDEELGHDEWILADLEAAGADVEALRHQPPGPAVDALVAYVYDTVTRRNPIGIFGMVLVLEGTSVAIASEAAHRIQASLGLPDAAFTYLRSHGSLDQEHIGDLKRILDRLDDPVDQQCIEQCARSVYWLYGSLFRGLDSITVPLVSAPRRVGT